MLRPPDRRRAGFTLLEMVAVLAVIGTLAALAVPSIVASVWQTRQAGAAQDLVGFVRGVRDMTRRSGVAHDLVWRQNGSTLGALEVWVGSNNRCRLTDWAFARSGTGANHEAVMRFDMARYNPGSYTSSPQPGDNVDVLVMRVSKLPFREPGGGRSVNPTAIDLEDTGEICFEPSGDTFLRHPAILTADVASARMDYQYELVRFSIQRIAANSTSTIEGVIRDVLLAPNGVARVARQARVAP